MYSKFGFGKFKNMCNRKHYTEECFKKTVRKNNLAKRDTLKTARDTLEEIAGLKMIVPSSIHATLL